MRRRAWFALIAAGVGVIVIAHVADLQARQTALQDFLADRSRGADRIAERYGLTADQCIAQQQQEMYPLAAAFLTVETFATPHLSGWARAVLARFAGLAGLNLDISIGPGRIRPSTARAIARSDAMRGKVVPPLSGAGRLLDPCGALQIVIAMLEKMKRESSDRADLQFIRRATVTYNGQSKRDASLESNVAAQIYFDLVYEEFQHYRFMRHR